MLRQGCRKPFSFPYAHLVVLLIANSPLTFITNQYLIISVSWKQNAFLP